MLPVTQMSSVLTQVLIIVTLFLCILISPLLSSSPITHVRHGLEDKPRVGRELPGIPLQLLTKKITTVTPKPPLLRALFILPNKTGLYQEKHNITTVKPQPTPPAAQMGRGIQKMGARNLGTLKTVPTVKMGRGIQNMSKGRSAITVPAAKMGRGFQKMGGRSLTTVSSGKMGRGFQKMGGRSLTTVPSGKMGRGYQKFGGQSLTTFTAAKVGRGIQKHRGRSMLTLITIPPATMSRGIQKMRGRSMTAVEKESTTDKTNKKSTAAKLQTLKEKLSKLRERLKEENEGAAELNAEDDDGDGLPGTYNKKLMGRSMVAISPHKKTDGVTDSPGAIGRSLKIVNKGHEKGKKQKNKFDRLLKKRKKEKEKKVETF